MPLEGFTQKARCINNECRLSDMAGQYVYDLAACITGFFPSLISGYFSLYFFQKGFEEADRHSKMLDRHAFIDLMRFAPLLRL